jgi:O-antigen ligase
MTKLEKWLFQILVFLVPTNLAYHWVTKEAYISGVLVDYLIPKLYISDIVILLLLILYLGKKGKRKLGNWLKQNTKRSTWVIATILLVLFIRGVTSTVPLASIWYWIKILELFLFYLWVQNGFKINDLRFKNLLITPLSLAIIFQSLVGLYQFVAQKSLVGYILLGETNLTTTSVIAKVPLLGRLMILPYGTTPHPNVLAGFLAIGMIWLWLITRFKVKLKPYQNLLKLVSFMLAPVVLVLSQAVSAWLALGLAIVVIGLGKTNSKQRFRLLIVSGLALIAIFLVYRSTWSVVSSDSITRRITLNQIAWEMIKDNPLLGVGLNNFTARMSEYGQVQANTRFLQPVHNVYLLWLAETGLAGLLIIFAVINYLVKSGEKRVVSNVKGRKMKMGTVFSTSYLFFIPVLMLLIIGLVDHYPLTLQTGQLMLVLSLGLSTALIKT